MPEFIIVKIKDVTQEEFILLLWWCDPGVIYFAPLKMWPRRSLFCSCYLHVRWLCLEVIQICVVVIGGDSGLCCCAPYVWSQVSAVDYSRYIAHLTEVTQLPWVIPVACIIVHKHWDWSETWLKWGCTIVGVHAPCIYLHARWELSADDSGLCRLFTWCLPCTS